MKQNMNFSDWRWIAQSNSSDVRKERFHERCHLPLWGRSSYTARFKASEDIKFLVAACNLTSFLNATLLYMTKQVVARAAAPFVHDLRCNKFEILEWLQRYNNIVFGNLLASFFPSFFMLCSNELWRWAWFPDGVDSLTALLDTS